MSNQTKVTAAVFTHTQVSVTLSDGSKIKMTPKRWKSEGWKIGQVVQN